MNPLPLPEITIRFDGATHGGNPGLGRAAAIITVDDDESSAIKVSNRMGLVGNNCAEYYGLILGLRELIHCYPAPARFNLTIQGDSELVIRQLKGEYLANSEILKNYYLVAQGLIEQIRGYIATGKDPGSIKLQHCRRELNTEADALAKKAADLPIKPNLRFWHYPCLNSFLRGEIQGSFANLQVPIAHDFGAACYTPEVYVDAGTLRAANGENALKTIKSTGKKNLIEGKVAMTVLGTTSLQLNLGHGLITINDALVVDFLPWPLQISGDHPACTRQMLFGASGDGNEFVRDWKANVPERFQSHPYWTSEVMIAAF